MRDALLLRFRYLTENLIWFWLALACLVSALAFFVDPSVREHSPVRQVFHPFDYVWNSLFLGTGVFKIVGLIWEKPKLEAIGLCFLIGAMLMLSTAAFIVVGPQPGVFTYPALCLAAYFRIKSLIRLSNLPPEAH